MNATPALLEVRDLVRHYGYRRILDRVSLKLNAGEVVLVLGPNGAGKSSLLGALTSRLPPESGELFFQGRSTGQASRRRLYLGRGTHVGHEPGLFLDLTARENLRFFLGLSRRAPTVADYERCDQLLARAGLESRKNDPVRQFSRGMQQRLALCRAFLSDPAIVLLDEPLTGLDREGCRFLADRIRKLSESGAAFLITTHSEEFFRNLAQRIVCLRDGRLIADIAIERWNEQSRKHLESLLYDSAQG